ncbi:MAG: ATP-binding protein [Pseudomonadota bacterium]
MFQSLRTRFVSLLLLGFLLGVIAIGMSFYQYRAQVAHTERLSHASGVSETLDRLFAHVLQASNTSRRFVLSDDEAQQTAYSEAVNAIPPVLDELRVITDGQTEYAVEMRDLTDRLDSKLAHLDQIMTLHNEGYDQQVRTLLISSDGLQRLEAFRASVAVFRSIDYALATPHLEQFRVGMLLQFAFVMILIFCGVIWTTMLGSTTLRTVLIPVASMINHVNRIAADDFRGMLPVHRRDEIGRLAEHINHMTMRLRTVHEEREQARSELAAERQNLVDALEALGEGFVAYDENGLLVQCNTKFQDYFPELADVAEPGVAYETLLNLRTKKGSEADAIAHPERFVQDRLREAARDTDVRECTLVDGRILQRSSYRTRNGGRVAVYVDITEIKRAESSLLELNRELDERVRRRTDDLNLANEQLRQLNTEMQALIGSAPVAIVSLSLDREVQTWNPAAIELTGLGQGDITAGLKNIVDGENQAEFATFLDAVYAGENPAAEEFQLHHRDGTSIIANVSGSVLSDAHGTPSGAILIIADRTEARALQHQFQQSQKMEVVAKLTAGLAHDFNNLLAIVISNLEMLESRVSDDGISPDLVAAAMRASLSGVALNQKLPAFSREQSLSLEGLDLDRELQFLQPLLQVTLSGQIAFETVAPDDLWPVLADRALLQSALLNMAVNARDAMQGEGSLTIKAENTRLTQDQNKDGLIGDYVAIEVADTGEGMSEETIVQAFQPFFTTKGFGEGSGLGLSMVYGFVKQSGGHVQIESELDKGTRITIYLPRAESAASTGTSAAETGDAVRGNSERILLVEDNNEMRRALAMQLGDLGFHTVEAESAATALELLAANVPVDIMLTDIVMPGGMDGRALAGRTRELYPELPIMFMSGYPATSTDGSQASWEDLGVRVLAKPIRKDTLVRHIRETLRLAS